MNVLTNVRLGLADGAGQFEDREVHDSLQFRL